MSDLSDPRYDPLTREEALEARPAATTAGMTSEPGYGYGRADAAYPIRDRGPAITDRVRWGTVWAGLAVALATFILLQLGLVATGAVDLAKPTTADAVASAAAAAAAFLLGGIVTGATARWRGFDDGLLHGIVLWAVGLVALGILSIAGSGLALGSFDTSQAFDNLRTDQAARVNASNDAKDAAGKALAGATVALVAAAAGGVIGAKLWPRDDETIDLRDDRAAGADPRLGTTSYRS